MEIVLVIIGLILAAIGVTLIYSARNMTKKWFSFGDQNEGVKWIKVIGFVISMMGILLVFFYLAK